MEEDKIKKEEKFQKVSLVSFAFDLGYSIAIPLIVFALLGRFADKVLGTSPWFLLGGILISIFISVFFVYRQVKKIFNKLDS